MSEIFSTVLLVAILCIAALFVYGMFGGDDE